MRQGVRQGVWRWAWSGTFVCEHFSCIESILKTSIGGPDSCHGEVLHQGWRRGCRGSNRAHPLAICGPIGSIANLDEQPLAAHGEDLCQRARSHFTLFAGKRDSAFSEGRLSPPVKSMRFALAFAVELANLDVSLWRSFEKNRQLVVRGFIQHGGPMRYKSATVVSRIRTPGSPPVRQGVAKGRGVHPRERTLWAVHATFRATRSWATSALWTERRR